MGRLDKGSRLAQMAALHRVIHQISQLEGQEIFEHLFLLRATCLGVFPTRVHCSECMAALTRGDYHHCHLPLGVRRTSYVEPRNAVEVRFVSEDWRARWTCRVQQRRGKWRRAVHRLQNGLLPSFSIFSQGENRSRRGTG